MKIHEASKLADFRADCVCELRVRAGRLRAESESAIATVRRIGVSDPKRSAIFNSYRRSLLVGALAFESEATNLEAVSIDAFGKRLDLTRGWTDEDITNELQPFTAMRSIKQMQLMHQDGLYSLRLNCGHVVGNDHGRIDIIGGLVRCHQCEASNGPTAGDGGGA